MLLIVLGRAIVEDVREAAGMTPASRVLIVLVIFLGLLAAGMAIPFAIGVPAIVYLLLHGGVPALKGIGLMSWGSMNSFSLTAIPLFILMAEIMQHRGPQLPHLSRAVASWSASSRAACCRPISRAARCSRRSPAPRSRPRRRSARVALPQLSARLRPAAGGRLAGGGRHARHPDPAVDRHDRLRHLHRDLGLQAVHGRHRARPGADRPVHGSMSSSTP